MSHRQVISQNDSESRPSIWAAILRISLLVALSLVGAAGILAVGAYLPAVGSKTYWLISRSSGIVAYVLITLSVLWGLMQSGSLFRKRVPPTVTLGMHSFLSWLGLGFAALHGMILIGDSYIKMDLPRILLPFVADYRPIPVALGIISFYLMLLFTLSFYARNYLGQRSFRLLHYGSFLTFVMVTVHGILAGTDSAALWALYLGSTLAVVALTVLRIVSTSRAKQRRSGHEPSRSRGIPPHLAIETGGASSLSQSPVRGRTSFPPSRRR